LSSLNSGGLRPRLALGPSALQLERQFKPFNIAPQSAEASILRRVLHLPHLRHSNQRNPAPNANAIHQPIKSPASGRSVSRMIPEDLKSSHIRSIDSNEIRHISHPPVSFLRIHAHNDVPTVQLRFDFRDF
jgi:hypothetical protein